MKTIASHPARFVMRTSCRAAACGGPTGRNDREIANIKKGGKRQMRPWLGFVPVCLIMICLTVPTSVAQGPDQQSETPKAPAKDPFSMDMQSLLDMKVTTASKFPEKLSAAPGAISVVTREDLRRFGGLTLGEILERVPGLAGSTASFTDRSIVAARGDQTKINGGHILFLINGRPTREVLEGGLIGDLLESFPVEILERIEVIKGPGSVLYGSNAFSAVVNLITQKADGDRLVVTGSGASQEGAATSAQAMFQRGDFSLVAAGEFHQQPIWNTLYHSQFLGLQNVSIPDRAKGSYLDVNYKGLTLMSAFTDFETDYTEGAAGQARWRRTFADLGYALKPKDNWDMNFNFTYTRTTLDAVAFIPFINRHSHEMVAEWSNVLRVTHKDELTFGALFDHIMGMETFFGAVPAEVIADGERPGGGFYAQLDHSLLPTLKLVGGFQANKIGDLKLNVVPRAGVIWSPTVHYSLKALYSEAFRAPSLNETLLDYVPPPSIGGPSLIGNPALKPEEVSTIDLALNYQGVRFQGEAGYFHSHQTNNIIQANVVTSGTYVNLGEAVFQGFEFEAKYYLTKNLFFTGSGLYQANHDGNGNTNLTPIANLGGKAGVSYESKGLTAGVFDINQGPIHGYSGALNPKPGAYDLLSANLRYDLSKLLHAHGKTGAAFIAHANNLTNKQIWLPDWKDGPGESTFYNRGRALYFGIELSIRKE